MSLINKFCMGGGGGDLNVFIVTREYDLWIKKKIDKRIRFGPLLSMLLSKYVNKTELSRHTYAKTRIYQKIHKHIIYFICHFILYIHI